MVMHLMHPMDHLARANSTSSSSDGRVSRDNNKLPIQLVYGVSDVLFHTERRRPSVAAQIAGNLSQECVPRSCKLKLDVVVRTTCKSVLAPLHMRLDAGVFPFRLSVRFDGADPGSSIAFDASVKTAWAASPRENSTYVTKISHNH
jgi:hypothetical protein